MYSSKFCTISEASGSPRVSVANVNRTCCSNSNLKVFHHLRYQNNQYTEIDMLTISDLEVEYLNHRFCLCGTKLWTPQIIHILKVVRTHYKVQFDESLRKWLSKKKCECNFNLEMFKQYFDAKIWNLRSNILSGLNLSEVRIFRVRNKYEVRLRVAY
jgi:hypothetical protein